MHPAGETSTDEGFKATTPRSEVCFTGDSPLPECLLLTQARFRDGPAR